MPLTGLNDIILPFLHWCALHFGTDCKILENTDESYMKELHHFDLSSSQVQKIT